MFTYQIEMRRKNKQIRDEKKIRLPNWIKCYFPLWQGTNNFDEAKTICKNAENPKSKKELFLKIYNFYNDRAVN